MNTEVAASPVVRHQPLLFPGARPLVGVLPALQSRPLEVMEEATLKYGPLTRLPLLPGIQAFVAGSPKFAHHMLVANAKNYAKQTRGYQMLRLVLGNGLVTSEGDFWKRQRRIAQPAFHRERLGGFGAVMTRAASEMVDGWKLGEPFDLAHELMRCTLRIVGETLLSADVTNAADTVGVALTELLEHLIHRTLHPLSPPQWVPTAQNVRFKKALAVLDGVVLGLIAERRAGGPPKNDLLAMLMESTDPESGEGMTDAQLRDEVMTIFLAGHETTANALAWTFALLGRAPEVTRRLTLEIDQRLGGAVGGMDVMQKSPFGMNVIREALRLYPPVWSLGRRVLEDDVVDGWLLPKGALVFLSPWAIHRLPEFWEEPLAFKPSRWETDDSRRGHGSYLPFSMGQRKCIGDTFAMVEAQLVMTTVLQKVRLELAPGGSMVPEPVITLRPRDGVPVIAYRR